MSMSTLETAASNLSTASDCQVTDRRDLTLWMPLLRIQLTLSAEWLEDGQLWAVAKASTFRPNSLSKGHWAPRCCLQLHLAPCGPRAGQPSPASRSEQTTAVRSSSISFPFAGGWAVHTKCFRCCCRTHAGGYAFRLCPAGSALTEECFRARPLPFVPGKQALRLANGTEIAIEGSYTTEGTYPANSSWARNPLPNRVCTNSTEPSSCSDRLAFPPPCQVRNAPFLSRFMLKIIFLTKTGSAQT